MQVAGINCGICGKTVAAETDATWCARCKTVLHLNCLNNSGAICSSCKEPHDPPERHFVYSEACPECMEPTKPPSAECASCGAEIRWDTREDYDRFFSHTSTVARQRMTRGVAELAGAFACLAALVAVLAFMSPSFGALSMFMLGFVLLASDGIYSIQKSRKISQFK